MLSFLFILMLLLRKVSHPFYQFGDLDLMAFEDNVDYTLYCSYFRCCFPELQQSLSLEAIPTFRHN